MTTPESQRRELLDTAWPQLRDERRAASQERPQPYEGSFDSETGDGYAPDQERPEVTPTTAAYRQGFSDGEEWANRSGVAQERPSIDVERLIRAAYNIIEHTGETRGEWLRRVAAEYVRLSGPVGE